MVLTITMEAAGIAIVLYTLREVFHEEGVDPILRAFMELDR